MTLRHFTRVLWGEVGYVLGIVPHTGLAIGYVVAPQWVRIPHKTEDHYHVGNVADVPDETLLCKVHGIPLCDGRCPKCER